MISADRYDQLVSPQNLEDRMDALEREQTRLREHLAMVEADSGAARALAAGADHDVAEVRAELRAHTQALNALRETQREYGQKLDTLAGKVGTLDGKVNSLDGAMREGFERLSIGMAEITALLHRLDSGPNGD
jgi:chromosome segregation ATPase